MLHQDIPTVAEVQLLHRLCLLMSVSEENAIKNTPDKKNLLFFSLKLIIL